jgi:hypothetical protein
MFSNQCALQVLGRPQDSDLSLIGDIKGSSDMSVQDAVLFAWRGCKQLNSAVTASKIDVRLRKSEIPPIPPLFVDISTQAIVTAARVHFLGNLGPDPHGLDEHQALSIHMLTPPFCGLVLRSNQSFQCYPELPLFFDFRPVIESSRRSKAQSLQTVSVALFFSHKAFNNFAHALH